MGAPHPQVVAVLERVARSPLPLYHTLPPFVARRIYRDTRAVLAPPARNLTEPRGGFEPPTRRLRGDRSGH